MNWMKSFVERILKNKVFWCCVLCVTALSFTAVCYANESGKEYSFWDLFFEGQMRQIFLENDITFESLITNPISIFYGDVYANSCYLSILKCVLE